MSTHALDAEANADTQSTQKIEALGRSWNIPAKVHLKSQRRLDEIIRTQIVRSWDIAFAEAFLPADQWEQLLELDPDEDGMHELGEAIAKALGFKTAGN